MHTRNFIKLIKTANPEQFIFWSTLITFLILWFVDPNNKIVMLILAFLIPLYYFKLRDFRISCLLAFISSSIVFTGKNYPIQILQPGILSNEIYPQGYFINFTITPNILISVLLFLLLCRDMFTTKLYGFKAGLIDILVLLFWFWPVFSDVISSKDPGLSYLYSITNLVYLIVYFTIRFHPYKIKRSLNYFFYLLSALIVFESLISFQQFLAKSPLSKNIESMVNIEYFGSAPDEILFAFRPLGTFGHANALGMWLASFLILVLLVFLLKPRWKFFITFTLGFASLVLTLSRSAWLGFILGVLICIFVLEKIKNFKVPSGIYKYLSVGWILLPVLIFYFVIPRLEKSAYTFETGGGFFRQIQSKRAVETIIANPFFGVGSQRSVQEGLATLSPNDPNFSIIQNVHNWYILNTIEHGIPYIFIFLIIILIYTSKSIRTIIKVPISLKSTNGIIHLSLFSGVFSTLVAGFFQPFINIQIIVFAIAFLEIINEDNQNV